MTRIIIDAEDCAMGRVASYASKQALGGNEVIVINSEKAVISGNKVATISKVKARRALNKMKPEKGPFFSRDPEKMMRRSIRGMLPNYRNGRGKEAWQRVKCYLGVPENLKKEKAEKLKTKPLLKKMTLEELEMKL